MKAERFFCLESPRAKSWLILGKGDEVSYRSYHERNPLAEKCQEVRVKLTAGTAGFAQAGCPGKCALGKMWT